MTLLGMLATLGGCQPPSMSLEEAREALQQALLSAEGEEATTEVIEVNTDFTIGKGLEKAAEELAEFWESQAPCTEVTRDGNTVTIDYGDLEDDCTYNGNTYAGLHLVTVTSTEITELNVDHEWVGFTNGTTNLDGTADVTWNADGTDTTRHVVHDFEWTGERYTVDADGDRVQGFLDDDEGYLGGWTVDGSRSWTVTADAKNERVTGGTWNLSIDGLEFRLVDPVPQEGTYILTNPDSKQLTVDFTRIDDDTIQIELIGARRDLTFHVNKLGIPVEVEEGA